MDRIPREDNNIFRILDLPEEMIHEIISCLSIKEAVRTSVLSQTWKDLWKNILNMELIAEPGARQQFKAMVEGLLALHNLTSLKKLTLSFQVGEDFNEVSEWLNRLINPKMKEIVLNLGIVEQQMSFPTSMFQSETLVKLELAMQNTITFPSPVHIPNLKILSLKEVIILNSAPSIGKFFSSLHSLEELTLIDCEWLHITEAVIIICQSLKKLVIREWGNGLDDDLDEVVLINGQFVPYRPPFVIFGGNQLRSFSYDGNYINDYNFLSLYPASARRADLDATIKVHKVRRNWDAGYMVNRLLNSFVNVKRLSITSFTIQALSRISFLPDLQVPLFENLVELNVEGSLIELATEVLLIILRNSPYLEALKFDMGVYINDFRPHLSPLPSCFVTCLKTIKICNFMGVWHGYICDTSFAACITSLGNILYFCPSQPCFRNSNGRRYAGDIEPDCSISYTTKLSVRI